MIELFMGCGRGLQDLRSVKLGVVLVPFFRKSQRGLRQGAQRIGAMALAWLASAVRKLQCRHKAFLAHHHRRASFLEVANIGKPRTVPIGDEGADRRFICGQLLHRVDRSSSCNRCAFVRAHVIFSKVGFEIAAGFQDSEPINW